MAFIVQHGERWRIVWVDETKGAGRKGRRYAGCGHGKHKEAFEAAGLGIGEQRAFAGGATTARLRKRLLRCYQDLEEVKSRQARAAGGPGLGPRYETPLVELLDAYIERLVGKVEVRRARGGRAGRSPKTLEAYRDSVERFKEWLGLVGLSRIRTGDLEVEHLRRWRDWLVQLKVRRRGRDGYVETDKLVSPTTVNHHLRQLRAVLNFWLDEEDERRPRFRASPRALNKALRLVTEDRDLAEVYTPEQLRLHLELARKEGERVFLFAALLMLTGARRGEVERLTWEDIDAEAGVITYRAQKTGRARLVPLDDPSAPIAPGLAALLRSKRGEGLVVGRYPRAVWERCRRQSGVRPKGLRSTWASTLLALGRPAAAVAVMAGHSIRVLERNYLGRCKSFRRVGSVEEALEIEL